MTSAVMCGLRSISHHAAARVRGRPRSSAWPSAATDSRITGPNCALPIALNIGCDQRSVTRRSLAPPSIAHVREMSATAPSEHKKRIASQRATAVRSGKSESGVMATAVQSG